MADRDAASVVPARGAFVVGVARSGTTLLLSLLDGHPELRLLPHESHVAEWCAASDPVRRLFEVTRFDQSFPAGTQRRERFEQRLCGLLGGPADVRTALLALMEALWADEGPAEQARLWVEKTPRHLRRVPELLARFGPATRVVCLVRDPRAVFASQARRWGRAGLDKARQFARRWATADRLVRRFEQQFDAFLVVRYEDLVTRTEATMRTVAEHLGLSWSQTLQLPSYQRKEGADTQGAEARTRAVSTASVDRFREDLEPGQVDELERLLARRMSHWGYAPGNPSLAGPSLRRLYMEATSFWKAARERHAARSPAGEAVR